MSSRISSSLAGLPATLMPVAESTENSRGFSPPQLSHPSETLIFSHPFLAEMQVPLMSAIKSMSKRQLGHLQRVTKPLFSASVLALTGKEKPHCGQVMYF